MGFDELEQHVRRPTKSVAFAACERALIEAQSENDTLRAEIKHLRAICQEWLPIIERQFTSLPPAPDSLGWQTALHRVERLREACQT